MKKQLLFTVACAMMFTALKSQAVTSQQFLNKHEDLRGSTFVLTRVRGAVVDETTGFIQNKPTSGRPPINGNMQTATPNDPKTRTTSAPDPTKNSQVGTPVTATPGGAIKMPGTFTPPTPRQNGNTTGNTTPTTPSGSVSCSAKPGYKLVELNFAANQNCGCFIVEEGLASLLQDRFEKGTPVDLTIRMEQGTQYNYIIDFPTY